MPKSKRAFRRLALLAELSVSALLCMGSWCTDLVPKHQQLSYVPTVMSPPPARPLVFGWDVSHDNLEKLYVTPATGYNDGAAGFRSFARAQGHIAQHLLPGSFEQVIDPATGNPVAVDVIVIALPRMLITQDEVARLLSLVDAGKSLLLILDHGYAPTEGGYPGFWGSASLLTEGLGIPAENTSVNYCNGTHWCPLNPAVQDFVSFDLLQGGQVYSYEGSSLLPADEPDERCLLEFPPDAYDLLVGFSATLGGHCQQMAKTIGCGKVVVAASIEPWIAYMAATGLPVPPGVQYGTPNGFGDANNPWGEEYAYAIMEWMGQQLQPGEQTCPAIDPPPSDPPPSDPPPVVDPPPSDPPPVVDPPPTDPPPSDPPPVVDPPPSDPPPSDPTA